MATRIRTLNFLPEIFKTTTNSQFLQATLDQIVDQPNTMRIEGYIGSKFGYGVNAKDKYVIEPTKTRTDYQLDPGVAFLKEDTSTTQDFISYPGIIDALKLEGGVTNNNSRLFESQIYSWDSFTDLDKIINFNQYYWLPTGPDAVTVSTDTVFYATDYVVNDVTNGYYIVADGQSEGSTNPTLTLLRGGTYRFSVNQDSQFWIQGAPGVTGYDPTQPNIQTRDILGVENNGTEVGTVTFTVPSKNAQDEYNFPGNNIVDVVSTTPFDEINGQLLSTVGNIDGITSLDGLTVMFYNTGVPNEIGYVSDFFGSTNYDTNSNLVAPQTISITATNSTGNLITGSSTANLVVGQTITFAGATFGGILTYNEEYPNTIYYVNSIDSATEFTISQTLGGSVYAVTTASGTGLDASINQGLLEEGYYSQVNAHFYTIQYERDLDNPTSSPVLRLVEAGQIPTNQKITARYGTQWIGRHFYRDTSGTIAVVPYLSAAKDVLYYQDGTTANKVGQIRLIDSNTTNRINVVTDILGKQTYTSPNGVVFTNGLKVILQGDIYPASYENVQYYVEGVGTAIQLVPVQDLIAPEPFTSSTYLPYDTVPYDIGNYDSNLYIPVTPDYITIARNSIDMNAWSRSNRWFHIDVINATATYNGNPSLVTTYATQENKAKRPIIEFYPNLRLFQSGVLGKAPVDFMDFRTTDAFSEVAGQENYYPDVEVYTAYTASIASASSATTTTITVADSDVVGAFQVGQFIADSTNLLPNDAQITEITGTTTLTITVEWSTPSTFTSTSVASLIANDANNDSYALFDGARIVFAADTNLEVRNKIYIARFATITSSTTPVITLTLADDSTVLPLEQTFSFRGFNYQGVDFYFDGLDWLETQQKTTVNQPPLFDIFDNNNISFGNSDYYIGTSFTGNKLFAYGLGSGIDDTILGFPLRYSSVDNVGDISFDVTLNSATFTYVSGTTPVTQKVNTGYVFNYSDIDTYTRALGWQTAVDTSVQYQLFSFDYTATNPVTSYTCDVPMVSTSSTAWPTIQVFVNNVRQSTTSYTVTAGPDSTVVNFTVPEPLVDTIVEVYLLSNEVSSTAYYSIPTNLNNNPLNQIIETANVGDIRGQYQSIFYNNPNTTGTVFGANNYRDLGNLVPWGTEIIQNSASLVLPGAFLRKQNHNLFNALMFNSKEYINFKTLLVGTVNSTDYNRYQTPAYMLDDALDQITASKTDSDSFFWSDMLPSKAAYITNTYSFANSLDVSIYPLSRIYNFATANYYGVLVYLTQTVDGQPVVTQLVSGVDYNVSTTAPSLTVTLDLAPGDQITIKEYNQTYGSFVPNTPTKLGMYPSSIPQVILDSNYAEPTYFIVGHDGSYNKLYGSYIDGYLEDFRDQVLLEFEKRVYNNLKLSNTITLNEYDVIPGFFRTTDYTYDEALQIYSVNFLNWVGQNRIDYKTQLYSANNQYTYNYNRSGNKINNAPIPQGYWRGIYEYFYDTSNPDTKPWEMLGFTDQPTWWATRYGPAPYTSDNLVLWDDLAQGINWNNGDPIVMPEFIRPQLLDVLPVDSAGDLVSPFVSIVGNYSNQSFVRDWKVGDVGPAEFSYRRSSTWPFDLMKLLALTRPAEFFNLNVDVDNYKYNEEFNQYLVNDRSHLVISDIEIYGNGIPKTSYINWIVDFEKQFGVDATTNITTLLDNIDVRLVYRLAGFSDKNLLKFYVEKSTANSNNSSLLIPDESYSVLLYDNQPFDRIVYSGVVVQVANNGYYKVYGNSQTNAYFNTLKPKINGNYSTVTVEKATAQLPNNYFDTVEVVPYGTEFYSMQEVAVFLQSYGRYLESQGVTFNEIEAGMEVNWQQMVAEFLYWAQSGWEVGSIVNINPAAKEISINKDSYIVQPLTLQQQNFILNQNLYPIQTVDLSIVRDETLFFAKALNDGDTIAYGQFNISNIEHGIVFDNVTVFDDVIYNLITGLRQQRITVRGTKTADWNGTVDAQGFILNQDNIKEWSKEAKYTTGEIVKYKNKYWIATKIIQAKTVFDESDWKVTDYNEVQKGLLPNSSTRSYESTLYYDVNKANLENDADLLSFSLIGYRPRDYLALADLTDITQINVYKNFIKNKGTLNAASAFKGANLPQGGIDYDIYENWAIKTSEYAGVLNNNFVDVKLNQNELTGNPSIVGLTNGVYTEGVQQEIPLYSIFNYGRPITNPNILPTTNSDTPSLLFPSAGYANFDDVKISSFYYSGLSSAETPLSKLYANEYVWVANLQGTWQLLSPNSIGQVIAVRNQLNNTIAVTFAQPHNLTKYTPFAIINFNSAVNGYHLVNRVADPYTVIVNYSLDPGTTVLTGQGVGFNFQSHRCAQPSDIINLPLLNNEFVKNKAWVDLNNDGDWAVYRKSINYLYNDEITKVDSQSFGSAVAYTATLGYLISDAEKGEAYRYSYNSVFERYDLVQTITGASSFGTAIEYADDIFVITQPTGATASDRLVKIYQLITTTTTNTLLLIQTIQAPASNITDWGSAVTISGDKNWIFVSDVVNNNVYAYRLSTVTDEYELANIISTSGLTSGDNFGQSISTDYYGTTLVVGAPDQNYSSTIDNWGYTYVFDRVIQNFEAQNSSIPYVPSRFNLVTPPTVLTQTATATDASTDRITVTSSAGLTVGDPVVFSGTLLSAGAIAANTVYYVYDKPTSTTFRIASSRTGTPIDLVSDTGSMTVTVQTQPVYVSVNGTLISDNNYFVIGTTLYITSTITAGDIITVGLSNFVLVQTLTTETTPRVGVQFGQSVDTNAYANEILVGAPFELNDVTGEGAVYRYTDSGSSYGYITGTTDALLINSATILINGFAVTLTPGTATTIANNINSARITNVQASALDGKLTISLINVALATVNDKLNVTTFDPSVWTSLGMNPYTQTQVINCPHTQGATQFGTKVKFNETGSFVVSAPAGTRYAGTTFDISDDENLDNDTLFDNNTTQWVDTFANAGAVYMYDYLENYDENLLNVGTYVYAQSINDLNLVYGNEPLYGLALDFNNYHVIVGTPNFRPDYSNGQVIIYDNTVGEQDWVVYRSPTPVVDTARIQNIQLYSASTNNTLENLDYIDPLQGKILGSVRQNIDVVSNVDPASYNAPNTSKGAIVWGAAQLGQLWFNTSNTRFVNYHQNDVVYNSKWWGRVFPGSDVAVYSWVSSTNLPINYTGPGTPFDIDSYSIEYTLDARGSLVPVYFYWVRNTNIVFTKTGKTLSDSIIETYISQPRASGISYFAPLQPNVFGLYNCDEYINSTDTVLHMGFSTGTNDDVAHSLYSLIRTNYADDFLPGLPSTNSLDVPESLYDRMLDSMCGVDETGQVVPNPFLPKPVQLGISVRPRQSFFINRFGALKNYLQYANEVLAQYPITEIRQYSYLLREGLVNPSTVDNPQWLDAPELFYNTRDYWTYANWWATGYNDNTKSAIQVPIYADLATLSVATGTIATVAQNGDGKSETYLLDTTGNWVRIGLTDGTIQFNSSLWDYSEYRLGFGDNFWDTTTYDVYPSEETRFIIRALNEQIYTNELQIYRNKSLILLFEYIQSETVESQNYLPWLNKTSFIDVGHTIRELLPIEVFQSDNQDFLSGYINEIKPYHVVIKEFLFKYTGTDVFEGDITDFDLPAQYNTTVQQFITPELVYANPSSDNQYLPSDNIWQTQPYNQWFNNYGVALTGVNDYQITTLASYVSLNSNSMIVDNAYGFPINGTILVGTELIGYSSVDRSSNTLSGLTRGVSGTTISNHIPGEQITIDLPAVLVLDGGRSYSEPPRVTAYIDTTVYPEPRRPAILEAVMNLDSILSVRVVDPGDGYAVLPDIIIDPALSITFASTDVNMLTNTIALQSPLLQTGDLIKYVVGDNTTAVGGLDDGQYYYVSVLETAPTFIVALYTNYANALNDQDRVVLFSEGTGSTNYLNLSARASCVSTSVPIRENQITLRFDRTSYTSQVTEWVSGSFYSSFYAGVYNNSESISSSSIALQSTEPPIESILASAQGAAFEIEDVTDESTLTWSSFVRQVGSTDGTDNYIRLIPLDGNDDPLNPEPNASGTTIGFYVGMPIKFVGSTIGGLANETTYYVHSIINELDFKVSATSGGSVLPLTPGTVTSAGLACYIGEVVDTTILTINYPGIRQVTATTGTTNVLTVPITATIGGTQGFYVGIPLFFTGNVFGGVIENETYYVTTVVGNEAFTMSTTNDPLMIPVTSTGSTATPVTTAIVGQTYSIVSLGTTTNTQWNTIAGTTSVTYSVGDVITIATTGTGTGTVALNYVTCTSTLGLSANDPIIFTDITVASGSTNIVAGTTYYVSSVVSNSQFTISSVINGGQFNTGTSTSTMTVTSQKDTVALTTATGSMTMNVGLPISPGQITGQLFTLYPTSSEYAGLNGTDGALLERTITAAVTEVVSGDGGWLYVSTGSGGLTNVYENMPLEVSENFGGLTTGTTYYVVEMGALEATVTTTTAGNVLICNSTAGFYEDMPIVFSGTSLGGVELDIQYYIKTIDSSTDFTISETIGGGEVDLTSDSGTMALTGEYYVRVSTAIDDTPLALTDDTGPITFTQTPTTPLEVDVSAILGGYRVTIVDAGEGYAIDNTITILGTALGGTTPANDLVMTVNSIDTITANPNPYDLSPIKSNGEVRSLICNGTPTGTASQYYLKVISATEVEVYSNVLLTIPVPISDFDYVAGDYALLPEPFYFNQSIVKYNNRVYQCIISNNDTEFIFGKWELLNSASRELNALDRIVGYYQPTVNMPGADLNQLVTGITYPNSTYLGNAFAPDEQYTLDTILTDQPFTPEQVNTTSVIWNGTTYIGVSNTPTDSIVIKSTTGIDWVVDHISNEPVATTDIIYAGGKYIITSTNTATPLYTSTDAITWSINRAFYQPLNSVGYLNGAYVAVGNSIIRSTNATTWVETYTFTNGLTNVLNNVVGINATNFNGLIAVGHGQQVISGSTVNINLLLISTDNGLTWSSPTSTLTSYAFNSVTAGNNLLVVVGDNSVIYTSSNGASWTPQTSTGTSNLLDITYGNSIFVAVGASGTIKTSTDGVTWNSRTSGTTQTLNSIVWNEDDGEFIVAGNNNTILQSTDGITWSSSVVFETDPTVYNVQGDPFLSGYGPEELVPGVISDNLTMIVATRPGTNWEDTIYQHVGYNVVSLEITPTTISQTDYSFDNAVQTPAQIAVYTIDGATSLATRIYEGLSYSINWVTKVITLDTPISSGDSLMIEVYEVGNGDQLVKSNSQSDPIRDNTTTGFNEIYLNCNYSATKTAGSGVVRPGTEPIQIIVTETDASDDSMLCENVDDFVLNGIITFQGDVFGGVAIDTTYYVKTISTVTKKITISESIVGGIAGPTFALSTDTGSMDVVVQAGSGLVWSDPIVYHNGTKLIPGSTTRITQTNGTSNNITCNTTSGMSVNDTIVFSETIFGGITALQTYYVRSIVDGNEFTISETLGGSVFALTTATGGAIAVINDYAFGIADNGISAKMILANQYDQTTDYLSYSIFGETTPQYGYTIPETQLFTGDGSTDVFDLDNYVSGDNPLNAVVEINGLRIDESLYTISGLNNDITFVTAPSLGDTVAVTSYNLTDRQYFNTDYSITGKTVSTITDIDNEISPPLATVQVTNTTSGTNELTCTDTGDFIPDQTIIFKGTWSGNVATDGTVYYVKTIVDSTHFTISETLGGSVFVLTTATGVMVAYVGGSPAVRVTTDLPHGLSTNDVVMIDGTQGSVQLNNNTYYVHVINDTQVDLYNDTYSSAYAAVNDPVTQISAYTSGGYMWLDGTFTLTLTDATATAATHNLITVTSTDGLVIGTPVIFTGTTFGNIVAGTTYYVREIEIWSANTFTISATRDGEEFTLINGSGTMGVTQWEQTNVDRLWVTVNGYRVPSSALYLNPDNNLSILAPISSTDDIIITSMTPSATPNEEVYIQNVNKNSEPSVYRANSETRTWLVEPLYNTDATIYVNDVNRITNSIVQNVTAPAAVDGVITVGLAADKRIITQVIVYNSTTSTYLDSASYNLVLIHLAPMIEITDEVTAGDSLIVTTIEGSLVYINGEQIRFTTVDLDNNSLSGLTRGANGTGEQTYIPLYAEVYGILSENRLDQPDYYVTWNSNIYNTTDGDPLQISQSNAANFLKADMN